MKRIIMLAVILAMAAGAADAKSCKDANGKFIACPAAASSAKPGSCAKPPQCKKGKLCGCACISAKDTCHKS
jgi:hypothetical protein